MEWTSMFNQEGGFAFDNSEDFTSDFPTKRRGGLTGQVGGAGPIKKFKQDHYQEYGANDDYSQEPTSWDQMSELTSWDQMSSGGGPYSGGAQKPKPLFGAGGGARGGTRGRGQGAERGRGSSRGFGDSRGRGGSFGGQRGGQSRGGRGDRGGRGGDRGGRGSFGDRGGGGRGFSAGGRGGFRRDGATSLIQKFEDFCKRLRAMPPKENAIMSVENGCMTIGKMKTEFSVEELQRIQNKTIFTGSLSLNNIFIARCVSSNKKELKHDVYKRGYNILMTKSVAYINELADPGVEVVRACVKRYIKQAGLAIPTAGAPLTPADEFSAAVSDWMDRMFLVYAGLLKMLDYIMRTPSLPDNPIMKLEQAFVASKCGVKREAQTICISEHDAAIPEYEVKLVIADDLCIGKGHGETPKQAKTIAYTLALDAFMTKPLGDIIASDEYDDEPAINDATGMGEDESNENGNSLSIDPQLKEKFTKLYLALSWSAFTENNQHLIDNSLYNAGLTARCLYKKSSRGSDCSVCEFHIEDYLISIGYGKSKADCTANAYNSAFEILTMQSITDIFKNSRKIEPQEITDPSDFHEEFRGFSDTEHDSNSVALVHRGFDPDGELRNISDMVIVETPLWQNDRRSLAFQILQHSATFNGILFQWTYTRVRDPTQEKVTTSEPVSSQRFQCQLKLNGETVSEQEGQGKTQTRCVAAADKLFNLYEHNTVVVHAEEEDSKTWVNYTTIRKDADVSRRAAGHAQNPSNSVIDRHIVATIQKRINSFFPRKDSEELVFGPGVGAKETREIKDFVTTKGLTFTQRFHSGASYFCIGSRVDMKEVAAALKGKYAGRVYAGFKLVSPVELSNYLDLQGSNI